MDRGQRRMRAMDWHDSWVEAAWRLTKMQYRLAPFGALLLSYLFGTTSNRVPILAGAFIAMDCVTGILKGFALGVLSSRVGRRGLVVKVLMLLTMSFGHFVDCVLGSGDFFKCLLAYGVVSAEALSIMENFTAMGVMIPERVKTMIELILDQKFAETKAASEGARAHPHPQEGDSW